MWARQREARVWVRWRAWRRSKGDGTTGVGEAEDSGVGDRMWG